MVVRKNAASKTPWSKDLAEPKIDKSAYVHSFSNLIGDVKVGAEVQIAPGTLIRADEGTPFHIGAATKVQDGVVIHGLEKGRVVGDDDREYSVWIGEKSCITHMALIHGPAYIGSRCFIGFRSTVFNARIGDGCIVMMHALIQDVEIAPGKYIPSGAIITNQQQADRLPDIESRDRIFADSVIEINEALRIGYLCTENTDPNINNETSETSLVGNMSIDRDIREQVRSLLSQGYKIGIEHATARRFKTKSWQTGSTINSKSQDRVMAEIADNLAQYRNEYVRLIGIDPAAKRRVYQEIIQRPGEPTNLGSKSSNYRASSASSYSSNGSSSSSYSQSSSSSGLDPEVIQTVRNLLSQGYKIGSEHADSRRFKTKSWASCPSIDSTREADVIRELENCLIDHQGEYVRLLGIDAKARRRVLQQIIQRPEDSPNSSSRSSHSTGRNRGSSTYAPQPSRQNRVSSSSNGLDPEVIQTVRNLLSAGYKIGSEHADKRRFKTKSWQTCPAIDSNREADVIRELENCLIDHQGEYVRLLGIDAKAKRRVLQQIIQRPEDGNNIGKNTYSSSSTNTYASSSSYSNEVSSNNGYSNSNGNGYGGSSSLSPETLQQVRSLLAGGYTIGTEHADKRRFRTKSWASCTPIDSTREADVIRYLEDCLADHQGEYVRLIGIDPAAKRRVSETIVQRP